MAIEQQPNVKSDNSKEGYGIQIEAIPGELIMHPQWVCWRYVEREHGRKPDKQPVNPRTLHNAGVQWPNTWSGFEVAYQTYLTYRKQEIQGIGFVLTADDPYVAVDIDACIQKNTLMEQATDVITMLDSYTEISPSGKGIRILLACADFHANVRQPQLELYSHARYVTITGHHIVGTPTQIATIPLDQLTSLLPQPVIEPQPSQTLLSKPNRYIVGENEMWERIFARDRYGAQHLRRFQGDLSLDGGDHSLTVIRLLNCLARWTQCDPFRMRAMILMSSLSNDKWFEKRGGGDWLDYQITDAIAYISGKRRS